LNGKFVTRNKNIIVVAGPTASGKTQLAIDFANAYDAEILSFDSRQFFKEIPIGTAAPSEAEKAAAPHHFIGNKSVKESFSAGMFADEARAFMNTYFLEKDVLVAVGGSGLYLSALLHGFDDIPDIPDRVRQEIQAEFASNGLAWLQDEVRKNDPQWWANNDTNNHRRLLRAFEVFRHTGSPLSSFQVSKKNENPFRVFTYGILWEPRQALYDRINARVDIMMEQGLLEEVRSVQQWRQHQALQTVGYREIFSYLDGDLNLDDAVEQIKQNTRRYAKRQYTWFRNQEKNMHWIEPEAGQSTLPKPQFLPKF
jgi:tRNA dimethylallyltransferase